MNAVAIVQARMGSTRLPGKVLADIHGQTMLARVVGRLRQATVVNRAVIATTGNPEDDAVSAESSRLGVPCFRGHAEDVLDRYYHAAQEYEADPIVRITADCPLLDPEVVDRVVRTFADERPDYASNTLVRSFPRGLDTEVFSWDVLARCWREAKEPFERAHVTPYIYRNPRRFRLASVEAEGTYWDYRWTVDTPKDLEFVRQVYARFGARQDFSWQDILRLLEREPDLGEINRDVPQKALEEG